MLQVLVSAERRAVGGYTSICNYTAGKDHRTYDLALAILHEEFEPGSRSSWVSDRPAYRRSGVGSERNSPYVSKFLPH
jgi:ferritin-like protein